MQGIPCFWPIAMLFATPRGTRRNANIPTRRKSSSFAEEAEGVNPPQSVYRICYLCSDFFLKNRVFFGKEQLRILSIFFSSAIAEDLSKKKNKTKKARHQWGSNTGPHYYRTKRSTHSAKLHSLILEVTLVYIKKTQKLKIELEKNL